MHRVDSLFPVLPSQEHPPYITRDLIGCSTGHRGPRVYIEMATPIPLLIGPFYISPQTTRQGPLGLKRYCRPVRKPGEPFDTISTLSRYANCKSYFWNRVGREETTIGETGIHCSNKDSEPLSTMFEYWVYSY